MTYADIKNEILNLKNLTGVDFFVGGYSTLGEPIYTLHLGSYEGVQILIESGIHAREYPATLVVIEIAKYLSTLTLDGGVYIIPMSNPDGIRLVLDGVDYLPCQNLKDYILKINGGENFDNWKANGMAVDLNVNFDALWGKGSQNVFCPAPANFVGYYPDSEREVRALIDIAYRTAPQCLVCFHTKGEVIYYGFEGLESEEIERDRQLSEIISSVNGYTPIQTENSVGGYSDWAGIYLQIPAFTIELFSASEPTPVPTELVESAYLKNRDVIPLLLKTLKGEENGI